MPICSPGCGLNAHCEYSSPGSKCVCNHGSTGNPYTECGPQERKKTCSSTECGVGAWCREGMNSVECVCPPGFKGNPYVNCEGNF